MVHPLPERSGPAFLPDKRKRIGSKRPSRPSLADTTVPAAPMLGTGPVPATAARGHRLWVSSGH
eukprot:5892419-Pyramimonas_sp.AAC.1